MGLKKLELFSRFKEILDCVLVFLIWKVDGEFTFGFEAYFLRNANNNNNNCNV
jgi:hypothetical protein